MRESASCEALSSLINASKKVLDMIHPNDPSASQAASNEAQPHLCANPLCRQPLKKLYRTWQKYCCPACRTQAYWLTHRVVEIPPPEDVLSQNCDITSEEISHLSTAMHDASLSPEARLAAAEKLLALHDRQKKDEK